MSKSVLIAVGQVENPSNILSCGVDTLSITYLGMPFGASLNNVDLDPIIKILERRLAGCRICLTGAGYCSFRARLASIATYFMLLSC